MMVIVITTLFLLTLAAPQAASATVAAQTEETRSWRQQREEELKGDRGWLAVSGLPWLKEGDTTIGSAADNTVQLADGPARWGTLSRAGDRVTLHPADGPARQITEEDEPFQIGRTWVQLIKRSDRIGLRLWDPQNERKLAFEGLRWYDVKPDYRVVGRFIKSPAPTKVKIANVIGQMNDYPSPGVVQFELQGKTFTLTPVYETPAEDEFFYIFKDETAAKTTYGAGRFVYSALPDPDGNVVLDFNRAYSPPCAYTDFATCPLPPPVNRLKVAIEAGELDPHPAH